mmetsp:Transcript_5516/g.21169  ORF Transcript_5516/g.21169 Transcript_5516/m.21169 type:complete len:1129 (+) Transcript_5516:111-3497(+)
MSVTVRIVDTGEKVSMPATASVPALKQFLAASGVDVADQVLLLGPTGTSIGDQYRFSETDMVYMYNAKSLLPGSPVPPCMKLPVVRTAAVEQESPSAADVRAWSENPRLGAVLSFQRKFRHHRLRAASHLKAMRDRHDACNRCLDGMEVQMGGLQVAKYSLSTHKQQKLKRIEEDTARIQAARDRNAKLLEDFPQAMDKLKKTSLHPALRQGQWETLIDCVPDERNLANWVNKCAQEHAQFGQRMETWKQRAAALDEEVQQELERRGDVPFPKLSRDLKELAELIERGQTLLKEITKDLTALTELASGGSGSVSHSQVLENYDRHEERHSAFLEELAKLDSRSVEIYERFAEAQARHAIFVHERLQVASRLQFNVAQLYDESVIFNQFLEEQENRFKYVLAVHKMPEAYQACEKHLIHRTRFRKELQQQVHQVNERLRAVLLEEQQGREGFWSENGAYLPKHLVPGLTAPVPNLHIPEEPFDELLPSVEDNSVDEQTDFKIIIAADPDRRDEEVATWRARCEAAEASGDEYKRQVAAGEREVQLLQAEMRSLRVRSDATAEELSQAQLDITQKEVLLEEKDAVLAALRASLEELKKQTSAAKEEATRAREEAQAAKEETAAAQAAAAASGAEADAAKAATAAAEEEAKTRREEAEEAKKAAEAAQEQAKGAKEEARAVREEAKTAKEERERALGEAEKRQQSAGAAASAMEERAAAAEEEARVLLALLYGIGDAGALEKAKTAAKSAAKTAAVSLSDAISAAERAATAVAEVATLEAKVREGEEGRARVGEEHKAEQARLTKELALSEATVAALREEAAAMVARTEKLESDKAASAVTRKSSEAAARAAQKEMRDAREILQQTQAALDASQAEVVVLKDELAAATKELHTVRRALEGADDAGELRKTVTELQAALEEARTKRQELTQRLEAAEARASAVERKAEKRLQELKAELKQVVQERNDSLSASLQSAAEVSELRNSGNTSKFIVDRIAALVRGMPQALRTDLQVSEMSDPAEIFSELLSLVSTGMRVADPRPMVALTRFKAGDVALFFKNPKGFYEAFNLDAPNHYIAPESLECFEEQQRDNLCILGEVINVEKCAVVDGFDNPYQLPNNTPYAIVTVMRVSL